MNDRPQINEPELQADSCLWTLNAQSGDVASLGEVKLSRFPFRIGRKLDLELPINLVTVSGQHATIVEGPNGTLLLEDSKSLNGTFVNGTPTTDAVTIRDGDLIQIAESVFRLKSVKQEEPELDFSRTIGATEDDDAQLIFEFEDLMDFHLIEPNLQSVVEFETGEIVGFEVLVRGKPDSLRSPYSMFRAAEKMQRESDLSELIREVAAKKYQSCMEKIESKGKKLFLNTHPSELMNIERLVASMGSLRELAPELQLVLEIHESSVTDMALIGDLTVAASEFDFEIAYDDFGAGQARFFELIEEPPAFLKFDIRLVKDLHKASPRRINAVRQLVNMVKNLDIICIAEGVEVEEDAQVCRELGFNLGQGYLYSRPQPIGFWAGENCDPTQ